MLSSAVGDGSDSVAADRIDRNLDLRISDEPPADADAPAADDAAAGGVDEDVDGGGGPAADDATAG